MRDMFINFREKLFLFITVCGFSLISSCNLIYQKDTVLSIESPYNKYFLTVEQWKTINLFERYAYLNVTQHGKLLIQHKLIYQGDYFDGDFNKYYPKNYWVNESIFRIGQAVKNENTKINVRNESNSNIKYLMIESNREKLIIFNINQNSQIEVDFQVSGNLSIEWIDNKSETLTGKLVKVCEQKKASEDLQFSINLTENNALIKCENHKLTGEPCFGIKRQKLCN